MIIGVFDSVMESFFFLQNIQNALSNKTAKRMTKFWFDLKFQVEIQIFNRNSIQIEMSCFVCIVQHQFMNLILSLHITNMLVLSVVCNVATLERK